MNKAELINAAAEKTGLSKKDTEAAITAAIDCQYSSYYFQQYGKSQHGKYHPLGVRQRFYKS